MDKSNCPHDRPELYVGKELACWCKHPKWNKKAIAVFLDRFGGFCPEGKVKPPRTQHSGK